MNYVALYESFYAIVQKTAEIKNVVSFPALCKGRFCLSASVRLYRRNDRLLCLSFQQKKFRLSTEDMFYTLRSAVIPARLRIRLQAATQQPRVSIDIYWVTPYFLLCYYCTLLHVYTWRKAMDFVDRMKIQGRTHIRITYWMGNFIKNL